MRTDGSLTFEGETDGQIQRFDTLDDKVDERLQSSWVTLVDCRED
jgi:hypothetical protein